MDWQRAAYEPSSGGQLGVGGATGRETRARRRRRAGVDALCEGGGAVGVERVVVLGVPDDVVGDNVVEVGVGGVAVLGRLSRNDHLVLHPNPLLSQTTKAQRVVS